LEQKHYRKWAYTAAFAASFAAAMPLEAAPAENVAAEPQSQAVVAIPDITAVPVEVVPAPVVTEEEALARQEAEEAKLRAEAERKAVEEAERKAAEEAARKAEEERRAAEAAARAAEEAARRAAEEAAAAKAAEAITTTRGAVPAERWTEMRPDEQSIALRQKALVGQTVVDVVFDGASDATLPLAKTAVLSRAGDVFAEDTVDKDRAAIYDVGLFYDIFPTFEMVPEGVIVTYHLLENPILHSVTIEGNRALKTPELRKLITTPEGEMLNTKVLHDNLQSISDRYHKDGYILVKVNNLDIGRDGNLKVVINEGTLEGYVVKGNTKTKDRVIIREMRMKPGDPFNAKKARRSMQRVYNLGFFDDVNMKLNPGIEQNSVVLEVDVVEKRTGNFTIGAGYSSSDGFIGMVGVGDRNFRGIGDAINLTFEFSGDDTDNHGYTFSYRRPWLDKKETAVTFRLYNRTYRYYDYNSNGDKVEEFMRKYTGGEFTFSRPVSEVSTNYITLRRREDRYIKHYSELDRSTPAWEPWRDANFGVTNSLILEHITDTRDNVFYPMKGNKLSLSADIAGFGGKFKYQKYTLEENYYIKAGHAQVLALRGMYGYGNGTIPEYSQYRIGGQNTIRGYRDEQFRGNHMWLGTVEYRFPVFSKVNGALFTDFGGTWESGWSPSNTYSSVGFGLSINTPVGPIRVDLAHGKQGNRVHFSVGGTF
jgi:outer membrane protein insertion porin family